MGPEKDHSYRSDGTSAETKESAPDEAKAETKESAPDEAPVSRFEKIAGSIKEFWATQIKGEVREKSEMEELAEEFAPTEIKVAKAGLPAIAGAMASMFGVKSFIDVPRYLSQKFFTAQEKRGLMEVFSRVEEERRASGESGADVGGAARAEVGKRTAELRDRIEGSKYLTAEKKAELLKKVVEIDSRHSEAIAGADDDRNKEFAKALNESIETKVKGTTALKETLNTMAVATGLSAARALMFGSVSIFERYQKVSGEMEKGERSGSLFNEMVIKGVKETFMAATFREGHTKGEKIKNAAEALASVMRFAGMTAVGVNELSQEGISGAISKAIEGLKTSSLTDFVQDNFAKNTHHLLKFMKLGGAGEHGVGAGAGQDFGHGGGLAEHAGIAAAVDAGAILHEDTIAAVQESIHVGESQLEVGAKIQEEAAHGKKDEENEKETG